MNIREQENNTTITTMCALFSSKNEVLMINRRRNWEGWAFPGGHVEPGESIFQCVIREMHEETGLTVCNPIYKGITHFYNSDNGKRHIIFNFTSNQFEGTLTANCEEGDLMWVPSDKVSLLTLAEGMEHRLELFYNRGIHEMNVVWTDSEGYLKKDVFSYSVDL